MPATPWTLRSWADEDGPHISSLLDLVYAGDPIARDIQDVHGPASVEPGASTRTLVATSDGGLVGAGTIRESAFAPARWRLSLHVHPDHRRIGIASALLSALAAVSPEDDRAIQTGLRADASAGLAFLHRHGFRHLMRTRLGLIDPARLPPTIPHDLATSPDRVAAPGFRLAAWPDLTGWPGIIPQLATLHAEIYRQSHAWSPPAPITPAHAEALLLGPDLIPDALFVALHHGAPIGVASLRHGPTPGDIDLGWTGVLAAHADAEPDLTAALLDRCLSHARDRAWTIRVEVDEADRILWQLTSALSVSWEPDWLNLERKSNPRTATAS